MFKKSKLVSFPFVLVSALSIVGCGGGHSAGSVSAVRAPDSSFRGTADASSGSVVIPNSLDPAALVPNDLGLYPLSIVGMSPKTAETLTGPDGSQLRKFLYYAVGCALGKADQFEFTWIDAHGVERNEKYKGIGGFAPNWREAALSVREQQMVSACLAARTNWYAEHVNVSLRGSSAQSLTNSGQGTVYKVREGAYWGNLFGPNPYLRACYVPENVVYSRSQLRDCAAGHLEDDGTVSGCGMIEIVGPCNQACSPSSAAGIYPACLTGDNFSPNGQSTYVMATYLHD
ncbi:MAG: hypothetical protein IPM54_28945 [Polyangiaceae bacterium]|nr:hypothetical protein [Polyangiaceae bacterium]